MGRGTIRAYWYTSCTSIAYPVKIIARGFTDSWHGLYVVHIPMNILVQIIAAFFGYVILYWLFKSEEQRTGRHSLKQQVRRPVAVLPQRVFAFGFRHGNLRHFVMSALSPHTPYANTGESNPGTE